MTEQCPQCGSTVRRLGDGTLERSQGTMSRAYVAQDPSGGWYGDAGNVMQESDPQRTKEQAQAWVIERLNTVAERPCLIYQDYQAWLQEAHKAEQELAMVQAEREQCKAALGRLWQAVEDYRIATGPEWPARCYRQMLDVLADPQGQQAAAELRKLRGFLRQFVEIEDCDCARCWVVREMAREFLHAPTAPPPPTTG